MKLKQILLVITLAAAALLTTLIMLRPTDARAEVDDAIAVVGGRIPMAPHGLADETFGAIADDGLAHFARCGEADTARAFLFAAADEQQEEGTYDLGPAVVNALKICAAQ